MRQLRAVAAWVSLAFLMVVLARPAPLAHAAEIMPVKGQGMADMDEGEQQPMPPLSEHESVIPPPPTGDEGIYKEAPNPEAGHEEEVIPPPDVPEQDRIIETDTGAS